MASTAAQTYPNEAAIVGMVFTIGPLPMFTNASLREFVGTPAFDGLVSLAINITTRNASIPPNIGMPKEFLQAIAGMYMGAFGPNATFQDAVEMVKTLEYHDFHGHIVTIAGTLIAISTLMVMLRFYTRWKVLGGKIYLHDWLILVSLLAAYSSNIVVFTLEGAAFKHTWDISHDTLVQWIKGGLFPVIPSTVSAVCVKLSFLEFYRSLSPDKRFHKLCYAVSAIIIVGSTVIMLANLFACHPISTSWKNIGDPKCGNVRKATAIVYSSWLGLTDMMILVIPISIIAKLQMPLRSRLGVIGIFAMGTCTCVFSILRIHAFITSFHRPDITYFTYQLITYSLLEQFLIIICACLPAFRGLVVTQSSKIVSAFKGTGQASSGKKSAGSNNTGTSRSNGASNKSMKIMVSTKFTHDVDTFEMSDTIESGGNRPRGDSAEIDPGVFHFPTANGETLSPVSRSMRGTTQTRIVADSDSDVLYKAESGDEADLINSREFHGPK